MISWLRARLTYANVVATGALAAALSGVAFAAIPDSSGVIHGCYDSSTGALRVTDTEDNMPRPCSPSTETALAWYYRGPPGPAGPPAEEKVDSGYGLVDPGTQGGRPFFVFQEHLSSVRRVKKGHYCIHVDFDARRLGSQTAADLGRSRGHARGLVFVDAAAKDCDAFEGGFQREIEFITERIDNLGVGHLSNQIAFIADPTG